MRKIELKRYKIMRTAAAVAKMDAKTLAQCALCTALIAICSWISIPATVPFTMQTFAVFLTCDLMGYAAIWPVLLYLLLGAMGLPVFAGFSGGMASLLGPTGGYLIGFVAIALLMMAWKKAMGSKWVIVSMVLGLAVCYLFGTVWFVRVYANNGNAVTFMTALGWCVFPYIIPDLLKIALARLIGSRVKTALKQK